MDNYKLLETKDLPHISSVGHLYQHSSGASVLYLKSEDNNKVFSATFKTPPTDDTGIAHIIEHCVLNGSRKYPLKDPFVQLSSGSLYTFLNAFTYPDKTVYPVASVNDVDFLNLMDVYLDAVFFPTIYDKKHSFWQEGWHYQLDEPDGQLSISGVVYNEMKGAYSDPYRLLYNVVDGALFPNSTYGKESGGNPDDIPKIDYDYFIDFHKKHYRPENCFIFFYGNMDIEACFKKLDEEYLSKFEITGNDIEIKLQPPRKIEVFATGEYSVADELDLDDNYASANVVLPANTPSVDIVAMKVLNYVLMATPASPLYASLAEAGIGEDISGGFSKDIAHPAWGISMKNFTGDGPQSLKEILDKHLKQILKDGISGEFVAACLNFLEFQAKEEDYGSSNPKGLVYNIRALSDWLYGHTPWEALSGIVHLEQIRQNAAKPGYFESLIEKYLLYNYHKAYVIINPVLNLDEQRDEVEKQRLVAVKAGLTDEEKQEIIQNFAELKKHQETPDTPELLALIPRLAISDIKPEIEKTPLEVKQEAGVQVLHSPLETNDIIYTTAIFDLSTMPQKFVPLSSILQYILSKVATKNYDMTGITQEIKGNLGGLGFSVDVLTKMDGSFTPTALVSAKFLKQNTTKMFDVVHEIIYNSIFDDKSQIRNYLLEMKASLEDWFLTSGSSLALTRSMAYFMPAAAYQDASGGLGFYDYLKNLCDNFDKNFDKLKEDLINLCRTIYNKNSASYSVVAPENLYANYAAKLRDFNDSLHGDVLAKAEMPALITPKNEAIITASKVQYCALSANFPEKYSGELKVLGNVLNNHLYEEIRAKGGAYGCGASFTQKSMMYFYSYRDPHLEKTYNIYKDTANYVRNLDISEKEIEKYILGAVRAFDKPATNAHRGLTAAANFNQGITDEMRQNERDAVLATNLTKLKKYGDLVEAAVAQNNICAVGSAAVLAGSGLFNAEKRV